jgi:hypothetical protein
VAAACSSGVALARKRKVHSATWAPGATPSAFRLPGVRQSRSDMWYAWYGVLARGRDNTAMAVTFHMNTTTKEEEPQRV